MRRVNAGNKFKGSDIGPAVLCLAWVASQLNFYGKWTRLAHIVASSFNLELDPSFLKTVKKIPLEDFLAAGTEYVYDKFALGLKALSDEVETLRVAVAQDIESRSRKCVTGKSIKLTEALERQAKLEKDSNLLAKIHAKDSHSIQRLNTHQGQQQSACSEALPEQTTISKSSAQLSPFLRHSAHCPETELFFLGGDLTNASHYSKNFLVREEGEIRNVVFTNITFWGKVAIRTVLKTPGMTHSDLMNLEKHLSKEARLVHSLGRCDNVISINAAGNTPLGYAIIMPVYNCNLQVLQSSFATPEVDMYSLAVIFRSLMTGKAPDENVPMRTWTNYDSSLDDSAVWKDMKNLVFDLVKQMGSTNPEKRGTAVDALFYTQLLLQRYRYQF